VTVEDGKDDYYIVYFDSLPDAIKFADCMRHEGYFHERRSASGFGKGEKSTQTNGMDAPTRNGIIVPKWRC